MYKNLISIEQALKVNQAYSNKCKPLCREMNIPQTAFDILMFLANNPTYRTARDISEIRRIKANLVSINVEKLVREGYLIREHSLNDRRKILLTVTEKASEIVARGRQLQSEFFEGLFRGVDENSREVFRAVIAAIDKNLSPEEF